MQALISGYSKTKFFDPVHLETHEPESLEDFERDIVGLIRAITVKVSARYRSTEYKRTTVFRQVSCWIGLGLHLIQPYSLSSLLLLVHSPM